jgi:predicted ABC-type ATPase
MLYFKGEVHGYITSPKGVYGVSQRAAKGSHSSDSDTIKRRDGRCVSSFYGDAILGFTRCQGFDQ